jgi:hypothetical protein
LLERLLLRETGRQGCEHAIGLGGSAGRQPRAYGAQTELDAVVAGGLGCEALVNRGGARVVPRTHECFGPIDIGWSATTWSRRAAREQQRRCDDYQRRKTSGRK